MKTLFRTFAVVLLAVSAYAQNSYDPRVHVGVRTGVTGSNMSRFALFDNVIPDFKFLPAPTGAIFAEIELNENFSIQPELQYSQKGFMVRESFNSGQKFLGVDLPVSGRLSLRMHYIEMPVLAKIKFGNAGEARGYAIIGPNVGYLSGADAVVRVLQILPLRTGIGTAFFKNFEFSGVGGLGYEIPIGKGDSKFFMEGRYQHGFTRVLDTPIVQLPVRNRTFGVNFGFNIRISK